MAIVLGENYTVEITGMNHEGSGVARIDGQVVFVKQAMKGELMVIKVQAKRKNVYLAEMIKILQPSSQRVPAFCEVHDSCGGCGLQHLRYVAQLEFKREVLVNALVRIAKIPDAEERVLPIKGMEQPLYYRNKVLLAAGTQESKTVLRFQEEASHALTSMRCGYLYPAAMQAVQAGLEQVLQQHAISKEQGLLGVMLRRGSYSGKIQVVLIANRPLTAAMPALLDAIKNISPAISGICLAMHAENSAADMLSIYRGVQLLWGDFYIQEKIGTKLYRLSPASFFQINTVQAEALYEEVKAFAALQGHETVVDAYCGTGTIGIYIADKVAKLIGMDVVADAIADARYNAEQNGVQAGFYAGKAEVLLPQLAAKGLQADVVIVDPPRKGCDKKFLQALGEVKPQKIIYVSCNPATLARDVQALAAFGYTLQKARPLDMFAYSYHVESVVLLSHKRADSFINVKMEYDDDIYRAPDRVTYKLIQEYIEDKYNFKVHTAYIAEVKRSLGLPMYDAPNAVEELKYPYKPAPEFKVEAIKDALRHFNVI